MGLACMDGSVSCRGWVSPRSSTRRRSSGAAGGCAGSPMVLSSGYGERRRTDGTLDDHRRGGSMGSKGWTLAAAILGSGIVFLDSTVITVALPRIGQTLPTRLFGVLEGQSYMYYGYLLTLSSLLILGGALSDVYGRRRTFALGLAAFGATSVL